MREEYLTYLAEATTEALRRALREAQLDRMLCQKALDRGMAFYGFDDDYRVRDRLKVCDQRRTSILKELEKRQEVLTPTDFLCELRVARGEFLAGRMSSDAFHKFAAGLVTMILEAGRYRRGLSVIHAVPK